VNERLQSPATRWLRADETPKKSYRVFSPTHHGTSKRKLFSISRNISYPLMVVFPLPFARDDRSFYQGWFQMLVI